jgi:nucleotidyltransferase/DNA polymerase involved in DNA repair
MRVSQAVGLCPSLNVIEPDPAFYESNQESLLYELQTWSPVVEPAGRGRFFIGTDGLERLYGPPGDQVAGLLRHLARGFPSQVTADLRVGCAPGKFGAWVAVNRAKPRNPVMVPEERLVPFLADRPVSVLPVNPRMVRRLEQLGVVRLGQLTRLPEPALIAQFGADGRRALAWATGRRIDPVHPRRRVRPVCVSLDFPAPVGQLEMLHAAVDHLLERGLARPARRGRSIRGIRLGATLEDGRSWSVRTILRDPTSTKKTLGFVLRSRIALYPPQRAVESLSLEFFRFGPPSAQTDLFEPRRDAKRKFSGLETAEGTLLPPVREAARTLRLRLGRGVLYRVLELQPVSRIPERRHALLELEAGR